MDIKNNKVRIDSIPNDSFISKQYYFENKLVKIYFTRKFKTRIEETSYYFRNDSMILGRFYVYIDTIKSIREINSMKPQEIYTSFIRNDTVIYESDIHLSTRHGGFNYLAIKEYEHANCITLNRLKLRYPCPNEYLPK